MVTQSNFRNVAATGTGSTTGVAPVWPGDNGATQIGRENNYYNDETPVITPPTALGQEYSLRIHDIAVAADETARASASATIQHWGSLGDGADGFLWVPTSDGDGGPTSPEIYTGTNLPASPGTHSLFLVGGKLYEYSEGYFQLS